jgi:hypothetical protein
MKNVILKMAAILLLLNSFAACTKNEVVSAIFIRNNLDDLVNMIFYYKGGNVSEETLLQPNRAILYRFEGYNYEPHISAKMIFDSIFIDVPDKNISIMFTHHSVTGYSENLFSENSNWESIAATATKQTPFFSRDKVLILSDYTFYISEDKIIINP